jgi:hypothetical protein
VTYHVVVAFDRDEEGDLKPGEAQEVMSFSSQGPESLSKCDSKQA